MKQLLKEKRHWSDCFSNSWPSVLFLVIMMILVAAIALNCLNIWAVRQIKKIDPILKTQQTISQLQGQLAYEKKLDIPNRKEVLAEVDKLFGKHSDEAKKVISCENSHADREHINLNKDNTADFGPFQVNLIHAKRFGTKFILDPVENVRVAYKIWKEQGWGPWYSSKHCWEGKMANL